jgi:hypothetical protein
LVAPNDVSLVIYYADAISIPVISNPYLCPIFLHPVDQIFKISRNSRVWEMIWKPSIHFTVEFFDLTAQSPDQGTGNYSGCSISGIDWHSTYNSTPGNMEGVTVPLLVVGMGAGSLLISCEVAYEHAGSSPDKEIAFIEGAIHVTRPIDPQKYRDTTKTTFDYIEAKR